jgi:DsbC/DsbD-like thiol-disulfide interchange protein/cytochrome c biogenesis protein CcdA
MSALPRMSASQKTASKPGRPADSAISRAALAAIARVWLAVLALACAAVPAVAQPQGAGQAADPVRNHIAAQLIAESAGRPGETVMLALRMLPEPGWHGYWLNPGDAGLGMTLDWSVPKGTRPGLPRYPVPSTLLVAGLMNHVYAREYAVLVPLTLSGDARMGERMVLAVDARWLACSDTICVPEGARLQTEVTVGPPGRPDPRFGGWQAALPAPLSSPARFALAGNRIRMAIPMPDTVRLESPHFFVSDDRLADYAAPQVFRRKGDLLIVEIARAKLAPRLPDRIEGVLRLDAAGDGLSLEALPGTVPPDGEVISGAVGAPGLPGLPLLLLAALAGGLLLNIMPCVFPILSLKALGLARAGESEAKARAEGLAYAAGVITACLALGGLLLGLRAGGEQAGWAFQLQEPVVVAGLLLLAAAITANLLGLFEFAVPGFVSEGSAKGAFATGLLAAFVATPCTGPFMAAAMGAALLLPVLPALALFAALGLGIALPFLAVAFVPALRRRLPRPGPWMAGFRRWMALPMGLTALALLWLASRLGGMGFALALAGCTIVLTGALAGVGALQRSGRPARSAAWVALAAACAALAGLPQTVRSPAASTGDVLNSAAFSQAALDAARRSGKPVFAWFTADWCLTCKVNEKVAIERDDVKQAFARAGVVVLKGDWTRRDPAITRYLTAQGAAGVPLYVWYPAGGGAPQQLSQILGPDSLVALTQK